MANIKELKVRIGSTKSTLKITSAMKLVSAAKLSKAQGRIQGFKPYASELDKTVRIASALAENYTHPYLKENDSKKEIILIISSDKGLCGSYNSTLYKQVNLFIKSNPGTEFELYFIGKKVRELLARDKFVAKESFTFNKADPTFMEVEKVASTLTKKFIKGDVGKIHIAYNSFVSAIEFKALVKQALPMSVSAEEKVELAKNFPMDFLYEPSSKEILDSIIPDVLNSTFYASMLDAIAAEHATRMTAMDNATTNSKEMIRSLTLTMNKLRQAAITTELTEIVSGAESLNS